MAGAQPVARTRRDPGPERGACERSARATLILLAAALAADARRQGLPAVAGASRRLDPADLSRPHDPRRPRLQRARGEPHQRHPARACVRRARPLLDLPHPRPWRRSTGSRPRAPRSRRCSSGCTRAPRSGLPVSSVRPAISAFVPLLSPYATTLDADQAGAADLGVERYLVIDVVDMRGSSRLAERRLPFDTVFIINQFLNAVSLRRAGGGRHSPTRCSATGSWRCSA